MKQRILITALLICAALPLFSQAPAVATTFSADEVMAKVFERDSVRESVGGGYSGKREYTLDNYKLNKRSAIQVSVSCDADGIKHFKVFSEDGWKSANKHVLRKMLESEAETSLPTTRPKTRMVPANYEFRLIGSESLQGRTAYVIDTVPKRSDKYLFRGRIWVDAEDFAVARIEGQPAKNPSFWTRSVHFVQQYQKNGAFWFPASTTSVTEALVFGTTDVSIRYFDYQPTSETARRLATSPSIEAHYVKH